MRPNKSGFLQNAQIVKIKLIGQTLLPGCHYQNYIRRTMGYCKLDCPNGETKCCICCEKQGGCDNRCDMMDSYEYAEECEDYVVEDDFEV